jgi:hypothetical protein
MEAQLAEPLLGQEVPTIFTPPLRELNENTTRGYECIAFAENVLGLELYPWQKWLLIHALEILPNGKFRFRTIILLVARQNGKSRVLQVLSLWRMYIDGAPLVIGTAQNLDVAEEQWNMAIELAQDNEDLAEEIAHIDRTNGKKAMRLSPNEDLGLPTRRYKVAAANRKGGRGLSGDLILLDELREHTNWESWSAVTKTTMARKKPQVWAASNAGDAASVVLRKQRETCLRALRTKSTAKSTMGLFEWSATVWDPKGGDDQTGAWVNLPTSDRKGWAMANPSLGWGDFSLEGLEAAFESDPDPVFRTECLCQWISTAAMGPWKTGHWESLIDKQSARGATQGYWFGVDVSWDRNYSAISVAGFRDDGLIHVEVIAYRAGTDWVVPWLAERKDREGLLGVVFQENGSPVGSLIADMLNAKLPMLGWSAGELGKGTGRFFDLVKDSKIRHRGSQDALNLAASTAATKPVSDYWLWDRKRSPFDISPLVAVNAAVWALTRAEEETQSSAYDDDELMFV